MAKQNDSPIIAQKLKVVGMVKDPSPSAINPPDSMFKSNPNFAYDIKNMRFIPLDTAELFDIVNERGNSKINITDKTTETYPSQKILDTLFLELKGTPIGINIINNELIIFTTENDGTIVTEENENVLLYISALDLQLLDDNSALKINYEILSQSILVDDFEEDLSIRFKGSLINIKDDDMAEFGIEHSVISLKDLITKDLSIYTFDYLIIHSIEIYYKKDAVDELLLLTSVLNKIYTPENRQYPIYSLVNVLFPNYTSKEQSIDESTTIEYTQRNSNYPELQIINGEIISTPTEESPVYSFIPTQGYSNNFKWFTYNKSTNIWTIAISPYPETLPDVDGILVVYYEEVLELDIPFFYEGVVELIQTTVEGQHVYEYNNIDKGSLTPENLNVASIKETPYTTTLSIDFSTERTFSSIEITVYIEFLEEEFTEVLTSIDNIHFENTNSSLPFKLEGEYTITIKSL